MYFKDITMKNLFYGLLLTLLFTTTPAAAYNSSDLNQLMSSGSCAYGDLSGADLSSLDLTGANLTGSNLTGARLIKTKLAGAVFDKAVLTKTVLTDAELANTSFKAAQLNYTNFSGSP